MIRRIKKYQIGQAPRPSSGQAALVAVMMFLFISLLVAVGVTSPVTREAGISNELKKSKTSLIVAEAAEEDIAFRIRHGKSIDDSEVMHLNDAVATTTITDDPLTFSKELRTVGQAGQAFRKKFMILSIADLVALNYAVQAGNGGFYLKNFSSVIGNIYSNGVIVGSNYNSVRGATVSAEANGLVDKVSVNDDGRAHTIQNSVVFEDAYYQNLINTVVYGELHPGSADPKRRSFPISDSQIDEWQAAAEAGGVINSPCPYVVQGLVFLGPVKINCDLEIKGASTIVTLQGHVWVVGDIKITNASRIQIDPALGRRSVTMIANDPADQTTKSIVELRNSMAFQGNQPFSFIILISRNRNMEDGGSTFGIQFGQTATGDAVLYSNHGGVFIANNSDLVQVTGYKIELRNSAQLTYKLGLLDLFFDAGPGGSWEIVDWRETE